MSKPFSEIETAGPWGSEREAEERKTGLGREQRREAGSLRHQSIPPQAHVRPAVNFKQRDSRLNSCLFLLCSCWFLFVCCEQWCKCCFAGCRVGGGNAGVALCSAGCPAPREQRWPALAKVCR